MKLNEEIENKFQTFYLNNIFNEVMYNIFSYIIKT